MPNLRSLLTISLYIMLLFVFIGCESPNKSVEVKNEIQNVIVDNFNIIDLPYEEWPGKMLNLTDPLKPPFQTDSNGVSLFIYHNTSYYHPVVLATMADWYLDSYYQTNDSLYLMWAAKYLKKLEEISIDYSGASLFPYPFNYNIHGIENQLLEAPWFSGMAQGIALGAFSLQYKYTGDIQYLNRAFEIFKSYDRIALKDSPWITLIDSSNYLWFEEYPDETSPNYTLNGFIYGIYGLYQFYQITGNSYSKYLLKASISTIKNYINDFRVPGGLSYYCLKHKHQAANYHKLHTAQISSLYRITGDVFFKEIADSLYSDYH